MPDILDNYYNNKKIKTVLGKNTYFNGNLSFKDSLKINGNFIGNIKVTGQGALIIGSTSTVQANIIANTIVIMGTVKGDVIAQEKVEMLSTGRLFGNIKSKKIKISDGAIFKGRHESIKE